LDVLRGEKELTIMGGEPKTGKETGGFVRGRDFNPEKGKFRRGLISEKKGELRDQRKNSG